LKGRHVEAVLDSGEWKTKHQDIQERYDRLKEKYMKRKDRLRAQRADDGDE
jgi:hypothetical protein